jgi:hypothetical protein
LLNDSVVVSPGSVGQQSDQVQDSQLAMLLELVQRQHLLGPIVASQEGDQLVDASLVDESSGGSIADQAGNLGTDWLQRLIAGKADEKGCAVTFHQVRQLVWWRPSGGNLGKQQHGQLGAAELHQLLGCHHHLWQLLGIRFKDAQDGWICLNRRCAGL